MKMMFEPVLLRIGLCNNNNKNKYGIVKHSGMYVHRMYMSLEI